MIDIINLILIEYVLNIELLINYFINNYIKINQ